MKLKYINKLINYKKTNHNKNRTTLILQLHPAEKSFSQIARSPESFNRSSIEIPALAPLTISEKSYVQHH